ncbi:uncharacterized protein LOC133180764 [Saccostrea echinata]|uniref:uncharacterized protein LOC133180764 n=1 Tax=Saccostrea echinata TaxID=191078 RepID=UPI002A82A650|nr:uncharacterized protein LOC133180764 [Saccostrea echinata]
MPIIKNYEFDFENPEEVDESFLIKRLSLYATVRPEDLKSLGADLYQSKWREFRQSLQDLFHPPQVLRHDPPIAGERECRDSSLEGLKDEETPVIHERDFSIQYQSAGIRPHEFPVIGFHVDDKICPGFCYQVRYMGTKDFLFNGEPRMLQSVGFGYGKRLTFQGNTRNNNENYFWSDSRVEGFAFSICAVEAGDKFVIYDEVSRVAGDVEVLSVDDDQAEVDTVYEKGCVKKFVRVRMTANVQYHNRHQGMLMDVTDHVIDIEGTAEIVRQRSSTRATTQQITDVHIQSLGKCTLWKED